MPWEEPTQRCPSYVEFIHNNNFTNAPWNRIGTVELSLIRQILVADFNQRISLDSIRKHSWILDDKRPVGSPIPGFDYIESQQTKMASSQPVHFKCLSTENASQRLLNAISPAGQMPRFGLPSASFSQPSEFGSLMLSMSQDVGNSQGVVYVSAII